MFEITVPDDIEIRDSVTGESAGKTEKWVTWMKRSPLTDARFHTTDETLESKKAIREAIEGAQPGDAILIHPNDFQVLKEAIRKPQQRGPSGNMVDVGYGSAGDQILPFIAAVRDAKNVKVEPKRKRDDEALERELARKD